MTKRELKLEDGRTLKEWVADNREPASEQTDLRERVDAAVDEGERRWKTEGHCHEADCGCWTEWVKRELAALPLLPQPAAPSTTPLRLSRDEIVKRGDAMTCPSCEKGLPKEANGDHNTDSIMTTCSCPSLYEDCTGRGTAIYELVLEAAMGPEQARELADTLTKHAIEAEKDYQ